MKINFLEVCTFRLYNMKTNKRVALISFNVFEGKTKNEIQFEF